MMAMFDELVGKSKVGTQESPEAKQEIGPDDATWLFSSVYQSYSVSGIKYTAEDGTRVRTRIQFQPKPDGSGIGIFVTSSQELTNALRRAMLTPDSAIGRDVRYHGTLREAAEAYAAAQLAQVAQVVALMKAVPRGATNSYVNAMELALPEPTPLV